MATLIKEKRRDYKKQEVLCQKLTCNPAAVTSTVTQATNRTTGVTLDTTCGNIVTDTTSLAAEASANFTVTNNKVKIGDVVVVSIRSGSDGGNTAVTVVTVTNGTFVLKVSNNNASAGTAETGAIIINFAVIGVE